MSSQRPFLRQVVVNTASSGLANVWTMVATIVSLPIMLRALGADAFGTWVLLSTFSATNGWLSLADLGVVVTTTKSVAERVAVGELDGARRVASNSLVTCTGLGGIAAVLLITLGPRLLPIVFNTPANLVDELRIATCIFAVQIVLDLAINSLEGAMEGLHRVDLSRGVDTVRRTTVVAAAAVAAVVTHDIVAVAAASAALTAVALLLAFAVLWRHLPRFLIRPARSEIAFLLRHGRSLALLRPLGVLQRTMDRLIVGVILGPSAVALVEIATQLQAGAEAVSGAMSYSVVPASAWLRARQADDSLGEFAIRGTKYALFAIYPVGLGIALLAGPFIDLWVGEAYSEAAGLTVVATANVLVMAPLAVGAQMLVGLGRASTVLRILLVAVSVNLLGSIVLVKAIGVVGVFQATLLGSAIIVPLLGRVFLREVHVGVRTFLAESLLPVVVPSIGMIVAILAVRSLGMAPLPTVLLGSALGLVAFGGLVWWVSASREEIRDLRSLLTTRAETI